MYYVSYGSNLNKNHMASLVPHAKLIGKGILKGYNDFGIKDYDGIIKALLKAN